MLLVLFTFMVANFKCKIPKCAFGIAATHKAQVTRRPISISNSIVSHSEWALWFFLFVLCSRTIKVGQKKGCNKLQLLWLWEISCVWAGKKTKRKNKKKTVQNMSIQIAKVSTRKFFQLQFESRRTKLNEKLLFDLNWLIYLKYSDTTVSDCIWVTLWNGLAVIVLIKVVVYFLLFKWMSKSFKIYKAQLFNDTLVTDFFTVYCTIQSTIFMF